MQTIIQIDDELLVRARKLATEKGCDLSGLIEETLRDKIALRADAPRQAFARLTTVGGSGLQRGVDLDNSGALLSLLEQGE